VRGIHVDQYASSVFPFGAQDRHELAPARIGNASIQAALGGGPVGQELPGVGRVRNRIGSAQHVADFEVLHRQERIAPHQLQRGLVVGIAALVGDLAMPGRDRLPRPLAVVRATPFGREPLLRV